MQSPSGQMRQNPPSGFKQIKVDNWGTFFLQRLQQLYYEEELLDLTIKFPTSGITVQAHRLVITTCTDYFVQLERQQKEKNNDFDGVIIMPPDMPYECVKSIISFMYTGQLEYWASEQPALYKTAVKMNMAVLTKLLDAQFNPNAVQTSPSPTNEKTVIAMSSPKPSITTKKQSPIASHQAMPSTPLPGRKLPIWRRKIETSSTNDSFNYQRQRQTQVTPGPSRFDLPDAEDFTLGVFSSFDDITYNTRPIVKPEKREKEEDFNRSIPDVDLSKIDTTEDEDDDDMKREKTWENSDDDWSGPKGILRDSEVQPSPSKRVRFELEEKENLEKSKNSPNSAESINNHAKIIREVLKKYPHLVKNNKNIRLKIMQKESKSAESNTPGKTKVSYVVLKSDHLMSGNTEDNNQDVKSVVEGGGETGPWKCHRCDIDEDYTSYYMYRRHMQDVHEEKFDPRVCEHCGYKATKRNILMYHMYTKHNVPPPKSMSFPKCHACSYVALSETLLVRHQINHSHRPISRTLEEVQCAQCSLTFKDVSELASHEINTGHGTSINGKGHKGHRCPHCSKVFVKPTNLQVHIDCAHKNIKENEEISVPIIPLEPSSEAEALSHVASGIAASLGVGDNIVTDPQVMTTETGYLVPDMEISSITQENAYNGHDLAGQQMIMLIDNENYQGEIVQHQQQQQQPQQLEISSNEQLVMQGTEEGMIVYIHGNEEQNDERQVYETYQEENNQEEEIVEEVEEVVEEVEEEVMEEEEEEEEEENTTDGHQIVEAENDQIEEVIQYVEEETEIVEYDEQQQGANDNSEVQESMMIIEEEHLDSQDSQDGKQKETQVLAAEWDEDSTDINGS